MNRILTSCTTCSASVQTDEDQTPDDSDTFHELVMNLTDKNVTDHQHTLVSEAL